MAAGRRHHSSRSGRGSQSGPHDTRPTSVCLEEKSESASGETAATIPKFPCAGLDLCRRDIGAKVALRQSSSLQRSQHTRTRHSPPCVAAEIGQRGIPFWHVVDAGWPVGWGLARYAPRTVAGSSMQALFGYVWVPMYPSSDSRSILSFLRDHQWESEGAFRGS